MITWKTMWYLMLLFFCIEILFSWFGYKLTPTQMYSGLGCMIWAGVNYIIEELKDTDK